MGAHGNFRDNATIKVKKLSMTRCGPICAVFVGWPRRWDPVVTSSQRTCTHGNGQLGVAYGV